MKSYIQYITRCPLSNIKNFHLIGSDIWYYNLAIGQEDTLSNDTNFKLNTTMNDHIKLKPNLTLMMKNPYSQILFQFLQSISNLNDLVPYEQ